MSRTIILRHGNTFPSNEVARRIGAGTDLPLVASGEAQIAAVGAHFRDRQMRFDRILSGPLERARRTAEIVRGAVGGPEVEIVSWLDEIDHGPDEGATEEAVRGRVGTAALDLWDAQGIAPAEWNVDRDGRIRGWEAFFTGMAGETLLCTSNGAARFALFASPHLEAQARGLPHLKLRTGAWAVIEQARGGGPILTAWDVRPGERS